MFGHVIERDLLSENVRLDHGCARHGECNTVVCEQATRIRNNETILSKKRLGWSPPEPSIESATPVVSVPPSVVDCGGAGNYFETGMLKRSVRSSPADFA
jgi:hypothetical protein